MPEFEAHITIAVTIDGVRNTEHANSVARLIADRLAAFRIEQGGVTVLGTDVKQILVNDIDFAKSR